MESKLNKDELMALGMSETSAGILADKLTKAEATEVVADIVVVKKVRMQRAREERLREALPGALAWALWETRMYHRSVLTGRCAP